MTSREWWSLIVKNILEKNSPDKLDDKTIQMLTNLIFDEFSKEAYWQKYEDCDNVLDSLKKKGFKLGIISNFDERLFDIINNLKLSKYFDFVCIPSNSNGAYKPQAEIFRQALRKSELESAQQILHIGDNFELDYKAALNSNFKSILLIHKQRTDHSDSSDLVPSLLKETNNFCFTLKEILDKLET